jgi:hypothetical protein
MDDLSAAARRVPCDVGNGAVYCKLGSFVAVLSPDPETKSVTLDRNVEIPARVWSLLHRPALRIRWHHRCS